MKYNQWDRYKVIGKYLSKEERETCVARTDDFFKNEIAPPEKLSNYDEKALATIMLLADLLRLKLTNYRGQALAAIKRKEKATK